MEHITSKDFEKLNLRIGKIKAVKGHPNGDEYILLIDMGIVDQDLQIVADLKGSYTKDALLGKQVIVVENIAHITLGGIESQGLLLTAHKEGRPVIISPDTELSNGIQVYGIQDGSLHYHWKAGAHDSSSSKDIETNPLKE